MVGMCVAGFNWPKGFESIFVMAGKSLGVKPQNCNTAFPWSISRPIGRPVQAGQILQVVGNFVRWSKRPSPSGPRAIATRVGVLAASRQGAIVDGGLFEPQVRIRPLNRAVLYGDASITLANVDGVAQPAG